MQHLRVKLNQCGNEGLTIADHHRMSDDWTGVNDIFHRCRADVLAAGGNDDVFLTTGDVCETTAFDTSKITGFDPTVGGHCLGGEFRLLVIAEEHVRTGELDFVILAKTHAHTGTGLADRSDLVVILPVDQHRSGGFGHAVSLNECDVVHAIEEMSQIHVQRSTTAGQPFEIRAKGGTNRLADCGHKEGMRHTVDERMAMPRLLVLAPLNEVLDGQGKNMALNARAGFLRGGVVHLLEHTGHTKQVGGFEAANVGEQMLGIGNVSDHTAAADAYILDVPREAVRKRQEEQQAIVVIEHATQNLIAVEHNMRVVAIREHGPLGLAGGTGGVDHSQQIVGLDARNGSVQDLVGYVLSEIGNRIEPIGLEVEHIFQARMCSANLLQRLRMLETTGKGYDRIDLFHNAGSLLGGISLIHRNHNRSDSRTSKISHAPLVTGGRVDKHHAPGLHAEAEQSLGHLADTAEHFRCSGATPLMGIVILPFGNGVIRRAGCTLDQQREHRVLVGGDIPRFFNMFTHTLYYRRDLSYDYAVRMRSCQL